MGGVLSSTIENIQDTTIWLLDEAHQTLNLLHVGS